MNNRHRTELALIARGIDSNLAHRLREQGWTLGKLQASGDGELLRLGVPQNAIGKLREGDRPPIPAEALTQVLFANRWVCCICRDASLPVIVHHIEAWSQSHDHSVSNLAVLCARHHGEAHVTRALEMTLTPTRLRAAKAQWEERARRLDALAIQQGTQLQSDTWLYFNHFRLLELATQNGVLLADVEGFAAAVRSGVSDEVGYIVKAAASGGFMYADADRVHLYRYMKASLYALLGVATVRNVSDDLDRGALNSLVVSGDLIYVQGLHTFHDVQPAPAATQPVRGCRSANKVEICFDFDRREATSISAWTGWLRGSQSIGSLIHVRQLVRVEGRLRITGTVIAMRTALKGLKERQYEIGLYKAGLIGGEGGNEEDFSAFEDAG